MTNFFSFEAKKDIQDEDTCYSYTNEENLNVFLDTNFDKESYDSITKSDFITDPYSECREETLKKIWN